MGKNNCLYAFTIVWFAMAFIIVLIVLLISNCGDCISICLQRVVAILVFSLISMLVLLCLWLLFIKEALYANAKGEDDSLDSKLKAINQDLETIKLQLQSLQRTNNHGQQSTK